MQKKTTLILIPILKYSSVFIVFRGEIYQTSTNTFSYSTCYTANVYIFVHTRKYYPSSEQNRQDAVQQKVPFAQIRLLDAVAAKQKAPFAAVWCEAGAYNIVESESDPLTRRPFRKRTNQGQFRGPPTYTHQVWRRSVKGPRRR